LSPKTRVSEIHEARKLRIGVSVKLIAIVCCIAQRFEASRFLDGIFEGKGLRERVRFATLDYIRCLDFSV
jgi:hypothetical protein